MTYRTTTREATDQAAMSITMPPHVPAHVALDKKVLTFDGYFKETVHESADEHYRVRQVKVSLLHQTIFLWDSSLRHSI